MGYIGAHGVAALHRKHILNKQLHFISTFDNLFTNALVLPVINGPTEGLLLMYLIHFLTAIVEIVMYKAVLFLMIMFAVMPTNSFNVHNVHQVVLARKGSMLLALAMLYPFVVLLIGTLACGYWACFGFLVSLFYLPFAIVNVLTAKLNDGVVVILIGR